MSPPTLPALLAECHRLRKHLRDLKEEIDLGPRVAEAQQMQLDNAKAARDAASEAIAKLKLRIRDDEVTLKQLNTQLAKFEKQLNDASSPKEYEAAQSEVRQAKAKISEFEEKILLQIEDMDSRTANIPADNKAWADAQALFAEQQVEAKERLERLLADQAESLKLLAGCDAKLPANVKPQYDRLVKAYGPDGLAGLDGRVCQHCRTGIGEQQRHDVIAGKFLCCGRCGRALYIA